MSEERTVGNSAWGNGYHQGKSEGFSSGYGKGSRNGTIIGAAITLALTGAGWGVAKLRERAIAKHDSALRDAERSGDESSDQP